MIVIILVLRLCTIVAKYFLIECIFYKKVLLVCWCSSLVATTHVFKLNEVELPHDVDMVITDWVMLSAGGASLNCVGDCAFCIACTCCFNCHIFVMLSSCDFDYSNCDDSVACAIYLLWCTACVCSNHLHFLVYASLTMLR